MKIPTCRFFTNLLDQNHSSTKMSQSPTRKRQHHQQSPAVKEEQQEEEEDTHLNGAEAAGISASQCSSSYSENSQNTIGTAVDGGNGGDDINGLKVKMAALEAKNQILESKLENQQFNARLHSMSEENILTNLKQENRALWMRLNEVEENAINDCKKIMDVCGRMFKTLEATHQQEIAEIWAKLHSKKQIKFSKNIERKQQQPNVEMPDCVVVDMPESQHQGTSNVQHRIVSDRKRATMAPAAALIPSPPIAPNLVPLRCHSAQQQEDGEMRDEEEPKRLCNPLENCWNPKTCKAYMKVPLPDQLIVQNSSPTKWGNIVAQKGFPLSACRPFRQNHFTGPILYYYEIRTTSPLVSNEGRLRIGLSSGTIYKDSWIGKIPNTYAMQDDKRDYCFLSGVVRFFDWPFGAIKPKWYGCGDVFGCGLVLSADNTLAIFFTANGILMGKQFPITHFGSILYPCVQMNLNVTVEANFGQKPFKYNIDQCPGLVLEW